MPTSINQYKLLISCPGDVIDEVNIIMEVVERFNQQFSEKLGITILPKHWNKSAYPQSGDKPQNLLNEQFVKDCDAAVAIFWTRFGTPTDHYESGSEEEINLMLQAGKQVFLYFCEKPAKPGYDAKQYDKVQAFKEKYRNKGIYCSYDSTEEFKELFFVHLIQHFFHLGKSNEVLGSFETVTIKPAEESDKGFLDFMADSELCIEKIKANIREIAGDMKEIQSAYLEILPEIKSSDTAVSIRDESKKAAEYIEIFASKFKIHSKDISALFDELMQNALGLMDNPFYGKKESREEIVDYLQLLSKTKIIVYESAKYINGFRNLITNYIGIESSMTQAVKLANENILAFLDLIKIFTVFIDDFTNPLNSGNRLACVQRTLKILDLIQKNPHVTLREIAESLGLSIQTVTMHTKRLKSDGLLKRIGSSLDKDGYWEIVTKI